MSSINIHEDSINLHQKPGFRNLPDGIGYMESCAQLMAFLKNLAPSTSGESKAPAMPSKAPATRSNVPAMHESEHHPGREFSCDYCHSIYWMTALRSHCPNCGAPPSA